MISYEAEWLCRFSNKTLEHILGALYDSLQTTNRVPQQKVHESPRKQQKVNIVIYYFDQKG
uniref:Uncharacterized protein n=1 Tax=Lepeophtheirus salmonis TaxID=72036 RepID=A0A0K2UA12_LEPSM